MRKCVLYAALLGLMAAAPTTKPTTATAPADFVVTGQVVDDEGKPVAGADVSARCGTDGNLSKTGGVKTDKAGQYRLVFEPAVLYERKLGEPVVGFQTALISITKPGHFEKNLGRQGDLAMTDDPADVRRDVAEHYAGVIRAGTPYALNFVVAKAAVVEGTLVDPAGVPRRGYYIYLTGPDVPPTVEYFGGARSDENGRFRLANVPTGYEWSFLIRDRDYGMVRGTPAFRLESPGRSSFVLTLDSEKHALSSTAAEPAPSDKPR